jgi:regulator of sigma E protease
MTSVAAFLVVIGVLILIHELGHFLMARWAGVGVERFSIGFGPAVVRWRGRETEYCVGVVPMGGYVKMMGEEQPLEGGRVLPWDPAKAFAFKPLWVRFLIVFAGPGMNILLAAAIFTAVLALVGRPVWPPVVGRVDAQGPAAAAGVRVGDQVLAVDGRPVTYWEDVERALVRAGGRSLQLRLRRAGQEFEVSLAPRRVRMPDPVFREPQEVWDLGAGPPLTPSIGAVTPGSPAERGGVKPGDLVLAVAGQRVHSPEELMRAIQQRPGQMFELTVERHGRPLTLQVTALAVREATPGGAEREIGRIGVSIVTRGERMVPYGPVAALGHGLERTWDVTVLTARGFWKLLTGRLPLSQLGGPVQIAAESGRQAQEGVAPLAVFTAVISVNLAVLNLLPIPMLDGGHLLFFLIEALRGRPLSLRKRELAHQVGLVVLLLVMGLALYNDLARMDAFRIFRSDHP